MIVSAAITIAWMFVSPSPEGFFPESLPIDDEHALAPITGTGARVVDADDESNALRYASMKRVLIRGVIDPEVIERAKTLLTLRLGDERVIVVNDKPYAFRLEMHFRQPGTGSGPTGWHKGVTVYTLVAEE
jgi:hypothetical protein